MREDWCGHVILLVKVTRLWGGLQITAIAEAWSDFKFCAGLQRLLVLGFTYFRQMESYYITYAVLIPIDFTKNNTYNVTYQCATSVCETCRFYKLKYTNLTVLLVQSLFVDGGIIFGRCFNLFFCYRILTGNIFIVLSFLTFITFVII